MRDGLPPWLDAYEESASDSVDPRVLAGLTLWLVAFGWYVVLQATPRGDLLLSSAGLLYAAAMFTAGVCFGWGEPQVAALAGRFFDRAALFLGGAALATTTVAWYVLAPAANSYPRGLWVGVVVLAAGLSIGVAIKSIEADERSERQPT